MEDGTERQERLTDTVGELRSGNTGIFNMIMMALKDKQTSRKHLQKRKNRKGGSERGGE